MKRTILLNLISVVSLAAQLAPVKVDYVIVPGTRVGPITASTGHAEFRRMFGPANVVDQMIDTEEGNKAPGTIVYKGDTAKELQILWKDDDPKKPISAILICRSAERGCLWHTQSGITIGTTLQKLEELNGKAFEVTGFFWDYGGLVRSWQGGKLERELRTKTGGLGITLAAPSSEKLSPADVNAITGDKPLRSDLPALRKANPAVGDLTFGFVAK